MSEATIPPEIFDKLNMICNYACAAGLSTDEYIELLKQNGIAIDDALKDAYTIMNVHPLSDTA